MRRFLLILILLTAFYAVNNYVWVKMSDPVLNVESEALHSNLMLTHYLPRFNKKDIMNSVGHGIYCPIYHFVSLFFVKMFGVSFLLIKMINIFWFIIALTGIYLLAEYSIGEKSGIYSMLIFSMFPIIYGSSKLFLESFGLMALIPVVVYFLFKSENFKYTAYSCLFGFFLALSFMLKKSAPAYLSLPILYSLLVFFRTSKLTKKNIFNLICVFSIFLSIVGLRYWNFTYLKKLANIPFEEVALLGDLYKDYLDAFIIGIVNYQLSPPFFILFIYSFFKFIKSYKNKDIKMIYGLWIVFPMLFFNFIPHAKSLRFILPSLPAIAIVSSYGLLTIKNSKKQKIIFYGLILLGFIQYYDFSFNLGPGLEKLYVTINNNNIHYFHCDSFSFTFPPLKSENKIKLYKKIREYKINNPKLMFQLTNFSNNIFTNFFYFNAPDIEIVQPNMSDAFLEKLLEDMKIVDFIVYDKKIDRGIEYYINSNIKNLLKNFDDHYSNQKVQELRLFLEVPNYKNYLNNYKKEFENFEFVETFYVRDKILHLYKRS